MDDRATEFLASMNAFYIMMALVAVAFAIVYRASKFPNKKPSKR